MPWWVIELITNIVLVALALGLGPFIKRFGRSYAADVYRANQRTGKSYLVLTDVAYYLIFASFVLFTVTFVEPSNWKGSTGEQLQHEMARIGGILLIMGVLHAANVVALPIIGRLLSSNKRLDESRVEPVAGVPSSMSMPPLGPGTWILRIDPAPDISRHRVRARVCHPVRATASPPPMTVGNINEPAATNNGSIAITPSVRMIVNFHRRLTR